MDRSPLPPASFDFARRFIDALPQARALGLVLEATGPGLAVLALPHDSRLVGDPESGVVHGGAVLTLMDTASGTAVMCHPSAPVATATLDLRIDYMRPARAGARLRARAECHHLTRSVAFVRVTATDGDEDRPVALAVGTFTVEGRGELPAGQEFR